METLQNVLLKFVGGLLGVIIIIIILLLPMGIIPPLGSLLYPNSGIYNTAIYSDHHGKSTLSIVGLDAEVEILYDEWGVPHIFAETDDDMNFAIGYTHAKDRLFQLEMTRRQFSGRLSEIIGEDMLDVDLYFRTLCFERSALWTWNYYLETDPNSRLVTGTQKYTEGINYYIDHLKPSQIPLEFQLLGIKPSHWRPEWSIGLGKYMAFNLAMDTGYELLVAAMQNDLGKETIEELFPINNTAGMIPVLPNYGSYELPITGPSSVPKMEEGKEILKDDVIESIEDILDYTKSVWNTDILGYMMGDYVSSIKSIGSNNWVIDGNISSTGYPILANDMHLSHSHPPIWYEIQHCSKESGINNYGFSFIGGPGIIAGHNQYAAWAFTNVGADVTDYYYYKTDESGKKYWNSSIDNWQDFTIIPEKIPVRGKEDYSFNLTLTGHGPVLSPQVHRFEEIPEKYVPVAMRWVGHDDFMRGTPDTLFEAAMNYRESKTLADFIEAGKKWIIPGQNFAIATSEGDIAIRPVAKYPIRPEGFWGRIPSNGSAGENEWLGYIPYEELAVCENPDQHFLTSTNQKTTGPDYKYFMGSFFDPGYRSRRITELIQEKIDTNSKISLEDMQRFQGDNVDLRVEAFKHVWFNIIRDDVKITAALEVLNTWGGDSYELGDMNKDLAAPTIFSVWYDYFERNTFDDDFEDLKYSHYPQENIFENLTYYNQSVKWFDNISTNNKIESIEEIAYISLNNAIDFLTEYYNTADMSKWIYGKYHTLNIDHLTGFDSLSTQNIPWSGSTFSLNAASGPRVGAGPSERVAYDLDPSKANETHAWSSIPGGQSGNPFSRHYRDQLMELYTMHGEDGRYGYHPAYFYQSAEEFRLRADNSAEDDFIVEYEIIMKPGDE